MRLRQIPSAALDSDLLLSFMEKVNMPSPDQEDCWIWTGYAIRGYGQFWSKRIGRTILAHRMSFSFFVGRIPDGKLVLHHCDNPSCINPKHLFLGTNSDNAKDAVNKGRLIPPGRIPWVGNGRSLRTHCKRGHPFSGANLRILKPIGKPAVRSCITCKRLHNYYSSSVHRTPPPSADLLGHTT